MNCQDAATATPRAHGNHTLLAPHSPLPAAFARLGRHGNRPRIATATSDPSRPPRPPNSVAPPPFLLATCVPGTLHHLPNQLRACIDNDNSASPEASLWLRNRYQRPPVINHPGQYPRRREPSRASASANPDCNIAKTKNRDSSKAVHHISPPHPGRGPRRGRTRLRTTRTPLQREARAFTRSHPGTAGHVARSDVGRPRTSRESIRNLGCIDDRPRAPEPVRPPPTNKPRQDITRESPRAHRKLARRGAVPGASLATAAYLDLRPSAEVSARDSERDHGGRIDEGGRPMQSGLVCDGRHRPRHFTSPRVPFSELHIRVQTQTPGTVEGRRAQDPPFVGSVSVRVRHGDRSPARESRMRGGAGAVSG
ncbi:hypothetical protein WOLCODRAFT_164935 [Wolfiporia cocos MD-104 SS10]|uniref:Uncharacterized protein n=1 Tax=Wolfiporia cocos (strain MD-104) TaxID=742152 RepID=A0A2H3JPN6_WOLCO|nr:hypothetical protein WOLCODRAFT_164935 [Wolfiporia cocos MD-104 SS10]